MALDQGKSSGIETLEQVEEQPPKPKMSRRRKLLFVFISFVLFLPALEVGFRLALFTAGGFNPYYLKFGFVHSIDAGIHDKQGPGYTKFQSGREKRQKYKNETIRIQINSDGFRGASDFVRPKPAGTYRIAVLGASSTFGFYVEDDETYPYQLEVKLRERFPNRSIEVINLGIPHARSDNCLALAEHELPSLQPDAIILYSGCNDANHPASNEAAGFLYRAKKWLLFHSVSYRVVHPGLKRLYYSLTTLTQSDLAGLNNMGLPIALDRMRVEEKRRVMVDEFKRNVRQLEVLAGGLDAHLILATQSYTLRYSKGIGLNDAWYTYMQELNIVKKRYAEKGELLLQELTMLIHGDMMDELRNIASESGVTLVEGIAALDDDRSQMLSYVHLSPTGNELLADAIFDAIVEQKLIEQD